MRRTRPSGVRALLLAAGLLAALLGAQAAQAAYPGKPGQIAFDRAVAGDDEIFVMDANGANPVQLTTNTGGMVDTDDDPAFSGDGKLIVWESDQGDDRIWIMNSDGSGQRLLVPHAAGLPDQDPAISRDGTKVVFERSDAVGPPDDEIFIVNTDGSGLAQLTFNGGGNDFDGDPVFSPDGKKIYFDSDRTAGNSEVWSMNVDGSNPMQLTSTPSPLTSTDPDVSQDGRRIVFSSNRNGVDIFPVGQVPDVWIMDAEGSNQTQLTFDSGFNGRPVFAPDTSRIAFDSATFPGPSAIFTMKPDGSELTSLTPGTVDDENPDWQPIPVKCKGKRATMVGTDGKDKLLGTKEKDVIAGLGGKDKIKGKGGKDRLCGGKGNDKLSGGSGKDKLVGGKGDDDLSGGKGDDSEKQ